MTFESLLADREYGSVKNHNFKFKINNLKLSKLSQSKLRDVKVVGHGAITSVAIDRLEWRYVLAGSSDGLIAIYDTNQEKVSKNESPKSIAEVVGITSNLTSTNKASTSVVQWHPFDNGLFVSSGTDGKLKVWDANVLTKPVENFNLSRKIYCHHISPLNPTRVAVATDSNHIRLVDLRSGSSSHELRSHTGNVITVKWAPHGSSILASGCQNGKALLWDVRKARNCLMSFDMGFLKGKESKRCLEKSMAHKGSVNGVAFSCSGRYLITYGCYDGRIRKWDLLTGINTKTRFEPIPKVDVRVHVPIETSEDTLSAEDEVLFLPSKANIQTLKINDGSTKMRLTGHFKSVTGLSFSRGRFELFSGSLDRAILIWDCDRTKEILFSEENRDDHRKRVSDGGGSNVERDLTQDAWSSSDEDD